MTVTDVLFPNDLGFRNILEKSFYTLLYLFVAMLGLHCCVGFSLVTVHGLLISVASLVAKHGLKGIQGGSAVAAPGF